MLPTIDCRMCDADGRMPDGVTCGSCMGRKAIIATCEVCRQDTAVGYNEVGEPACATCLATNDRNEAA